MKLILIADVMCLIALLVPLHMQGAWIIGLVLGFIVSYGSFKQDKTATVVYIIISWCLTLLVAVYLVAAIVGAIFISLPDQSIVIFIMVTCLILGFKICLGINVGYYLSIRRSEV